MNISIRFNAYVLRLYTCVAFGEVGGGVNTLPLKALEQLALALGSLHVFPSKLSRMQGRKFFKKLSYTFLKWKVLESDIISQLYLKETGQTKDSVIKIEESYGPSYYFTKNQH